MQHAGTGGCYNGIITVATPAIVAGYGRVISTEVCPVAASREINTIFFP